MSDESSFRTDAVRAARANALLEDELIVEAFASLKASYIAAWEDSPARDTDAREKLWQAVQIVGKVRSHLETILRNGTVAEAELRRMTDRPKRFGIV